MRIAYRPSLPPTPPPVPKEEVSNPRPSRRSLAALSLGALGLMGAAAPVAADVLVAPTPQPEGLSLTEQIRARQNQPLTVFKGDPPSRGESPLRDLPSSRDLRGESPLRDLPSFENLKRVDVTPQWSVSASQQNDSMPRWLEWVPTQGSNRIPGKSQYDDDGWTAEVQLQATRTQGDEQWVGGLRYSMITQRGAWEPVAPDYRGLRTDLGEFTLQKNQRVDLGQGQTFYYGVGAGVQAIGNLGGHTVQEQFHIHGGFGGRTGAALQANYSTEGYTVYPMVTAGVRLDQPLNLRDLSLRSSLSTSLAVGRGISTLQGQMGLNFQPSSRFNVETGLMAAGVYSNHPALDFLHPNGIRPGAYIESNYQVSKHIRAFGRVQTGGVQGEPVYLVGFAIGAGPGPWIRPSFQ